MRSAADHSRLLYLLPRYDADSPEHVYHLYGFLAKLGSRIPLDVLVERTRGTIAPDFPLQPLRIQFPALRMVEEFFRFAAARRRGIRTFYVHYSYTGAIAASLVVKIFGGTVFYWNCSLYKELRLPPSAPRIERARQRIQEILLETSIRMCTYLVTGTPRVTEYYTRNVGVPLSKIRLLPNFVDVDRFQNVSRTEARRILGLDPDRKVILFLHRVALRKGAHRLEEISRRVRKEIPATVLVAGGGPFLEELQRRVAAAGQGEWFDFRGWIPNRNVPLYFRAADLYVMPSEEEGFPRVLLEAMAAGCPFVAFDVGGVRDIVPPRLEESVVAKGDVGAFSNACIRTLRDANGRADRRSAGERQAQLFSEERVLEAFQRMVAGEALDWSVFLCAKEGR